jgi:hypothetical protein
MVDLKHVGRIAASGRKCLVAYRTLPGEANSCLVVQTENLPDEQHNALINLVESPSAQESVEFAEVLARSHFPDGSIMLAALHSQGKLTKLATDQVEMVPNFSTSISLAELNSIIAQQMNVAIDDLAIKPANGKVNPNVEIQEVATVNEIPAEVADIGKTTSASVNETAPVTFESPEAEAKFYRSQADKLAKDAAAMRRKAEELSPTKKK